MPAGPLGWESLPNVLAVHGAPTDEDEYMPLRYNPLMSGYARVLLLEPRKFRFTVGLEF